MTALQTFDFRGEELRMVMVDDEPWFIAVDACACLGIGDTHVALRRLDPDEKGRCSAPTPGGPQEVRTVSEAGLYKLIARSDKPTAKRFQRWVTHEVLPSIRRTGSYSVASDDDDLDDLDQVNANAQAALALVAQNQALLQRHVAKVARRVEVIDQRVDDLETAKAIQLIPATKKQAIALVRKSFSRALTYAFADEAAQAHRDGQSGEFWQGVNGALVKAVGAKRAGWRHEHYVLAVQWLHDHAGKDLSHVLEGRAEPAPTRSRRPRG